MCSNRVLSWAISPISANGTLGCPLCQDPLNPSLPSPPCSTSPCGGPLCPKPSCQLLMTRAHISLRTVLTPVLHCFLGACYISFPGLGLPLSHLLPIKPLPCAASHTRLTAATPLGKLLCKVSLLDDQMSPPQKGAPRSLLFFVLASKAALFPSCCYPRPARQSCLFFFPSPSPLLSPGPSTPARSSVQAPSTLDSHL